MDRCPLHSTIRANSCSRPVRTLGASPAPTASPRVPLKRQSNSAQVVCLWVRLFRVTVNNGLRSEADEPKNWCLTQIQPTGPFPREVRHRLSQGEGWGSLGRQVPPKVFFGTADCCAAKICLKGAPQP